MQAKVVIPICVSEDGVYTYSLGKKELRNKIPFGFTKFVGSDSEYVYHVKGNYLTKYNITSFTDDKYIDLHGDFERGILRDGKLYIVINKDISVVTCVYDKQLKFLSLEKEQVIDVFQGHLLSTQSYLAVSVDKQVVLYGTFSTKLHLESPQLVATDKIVYSTRRELLCIDNKRVLRWRHPLKGEIFKLQVEGNSAIAIHGDILAEERYLTVINTLTGKKQASVQIGDYRGVVVLENFLYITSGYTVTIYTFPDLEPVTVDAHCQQHYCSLFDTLNETYPKVLAQLILENLYYTKDGYAVQTPGSSLPLRDIPGLGRIVPGFAYRHLQPFNADFDGDEANVYLPLYEGRRR